MHPLVVNQPDPPGHLSPSAMRAFEMAEKADWSQGLSLTDTLVRVNKVAARLFPDGDGRDSRVSRVFTPRSFRHYQTLGCIDAPERAGKQVVYGFRHFVQALLVRRLLWERMASDRIVALMVGRSTAEIRRMLLEGIEMVARDGATERDPEYGPDAVALWKCVQVSPGIELHMSCDLPKPKPAELRKLLADLETALRKNL